MLAFAIVMAVIPYLLLERAVLRRYIALDAGVYAAGLALWMLAPLTGVIVTPALALALFVVIKLALFCAFLAGIETSWTPNRAAILAGLVYALLVPHVLQWPIDGDEPFYLLIAESLVRDGDLDLANQYREIESSATRRPDLVPQPGDPTGLRGEQYSRHEPFLSLLLIPGLMIGRLTGAVMTIALFGALLVRSTMLLLEESGVSGRTRVLLFPFIAFGPPVIFYATRIWPEIPAAFFFCEALRSASRTIGGSGETRRGEWWRLAAAGLALALLKVRFAAITAALFLLVLAHAPKGDGRSKRVAGLLLLLLVPFAALFLISGNPLNIHEPSALMPQSPSRYLTGLFGLTLDGAAGLLFQAPLYLLAAFAAARWTSSSPPFRLAALSSSLYFLLLLPRAEWHGGWSPPLRYLVVFVPLFALGAAEMMERRRRGWILPLWLVAAWSGGLVVHGIAYPWRLFRIANGENAVGEWLSRLYLSDFSRLVPSYIRIDLAALVAAICLAIAIAVVAVAPRISLRSPPPAINAVLASMLIVALFIAGRSPGRVVHFEDAHVVHDGGSLYPREWTVSRFLYRGGWELWPGDSVAFLYRGGPSVLHYHSHEPATIEIAGRRVDLPSTSGLWTARRIELPWVKQRLRLGVHAGIVIVDRIESE